MMKRKTRNEGEELPAAKSPHRSGQIRKPLTMDGSIIEKEAGIASFLIVGYVL
jgi:hypothetical protein